MEERYLKHVGIMTEDELHTVQTTSVLLVGCGGIGGYIADQLTRFGIKRITIVDYDCFDRSNLNRQLFCTENTIGSYKVDILQKELHTINSSCIISTSKNKIEEESDTIYQGIDVIIDAVDNPSTKVYLSKQAATHNIPLLHGACAGWYGQVAWILPGCTLLEDLYKDQEHGLEKNLENPPFAPSVTASIMMSEFIKHLIHPHLDGVNELLLIDLYNNVFSSTKEES
jgi:molybdopterin/thiamine biosynthesis adenylyltransferase